MNKKKSRKALFYLKKIVILKPMAVKKQTVALIATIASFSFLTPKEVEYRVWVPNPYETPITKKASSIANGTQLP